MPRGKHAPKSSTSFILSLSRAMGGLLAAVGLVVAIALVAVRSGSDEPRAAGTPTPAPASPTTSPQATPSPAPTAAADVQPPSEVTVEVHNGAGRPGIAARTAERLREEGYDVDPDEDIDNAELTKESTIFYRPGRKEEAQALQRKFPEFT